jgi:hypothetical protein
MVYGNIFFMVGETMEHLTCSAARVNQCPGFFPRSVMTLALLPQIMAEGSLPMARNFKNSDVLSP